MTLRTKIEEAIGERHVHKIDNSELLDQICTIFEEETIKQVKWALNEFEKRFINSLEDTDEKK
jgi:hypothetical protein